jgi:hypothetical protein
MDGQLLKRKAGRSGAVNARQIKDNANDAAQRSTQYCETAKRLLEEFGEAVKQVLVLHEQQFQAIVEGDTGASRFDLLIHEASERKQQAKYAYLNHVGLHDCSL